MGYLWNDPDKGNTDVTLKKTRPTATCSPQIQQEVARDKTRVSAVTDRRLARLCVILFSFYSTENPHWLRI
jgi:hypothetical protein